MDRTVTGPQASRPTLKFVSIAHPDEIRDTRNKRMIHQHVMRDIGLSRRKRKSSARVQLDIVSPPSQPSKTNPINDGEAPGTSTPHHGQKRPGVDLQLIPAPRADLSLYACFDARARSMKGFLMRDSSLMCDMVREMCFAVALVDDGAMHLTFAESALRRNPEEGKLVLHESSGALGHYNLALQHVNYKIQKVNSRRCNGIISTVVGLASYDLSVGNLARWATHMEGLKVIIQAQGGLKALKPECLLRSLVWTDVVGCLSLDRVPHFEAQIGSATDFLEQRDTPILTTIHGVLKRSPSELPATHGVLQSLSAIAKVSSGRLGQTRHIGFPYLLSLARTCDSLLRLPRLDGAYYAGISPSRAQLLHEVIRLAILIFLGKLVEHIHGSLGVIGSHVDLLSGLLRQHELDWDGIRELELWVLAIAAMVARNKDREWLASRIVRTMEEIGIGWDGTRVILGQIAWVDAVFGEDLPKLEKQLSEVS